MASGLGGFLAELRRRKVWRVAAAYGATALGTALAVAELYDDVGFPEGTPRIVIFVLAAGFPIALALAWAFDWTPEGVRRDTGAEQAIDGALAGPTPAESQAADVTAGATTTPPSDRSSIAVLPLLNLSGDPDNEYFSDGVTDEILRHLAQIHELKVISRTSVMRYKGTGKSIREIAAELQVGTVLEGSVQRAPGKVRVVVQLIDASTDVHLWAETYDRDLEHVFEIQSDIALRVAEALRASLSPDREDRIRSQPTESLDAHDAYLLGWHHVWGATEEGHRKAEGYFKQALDLDPDYALAHAGLAYWYILAGGSGFALFPTAEAISRAKAEAQRAIALDPELGDAHATLAVAESEYGEWGRAEEAARLGVEGDPNSSWAWLSFAVVLGVAGRHEECVAAVDRAVELEPLVMMTLNHAAWHYCNAGRVDEALEYARRCEEVDSGFFGAIQVAFVLQCRGENDEALLQLARVREHWEALRDFGLYWVLAYALGQAGRRAEFEESVAHLERRAAEGTTSWAEPALACLGIDDHERALDYLDRAFGGPLPASDLMKWVGVLPHFASLREDPRFQQVLKRLGLA